MPRCRVGVRVEVGELGAARERALEQPRGDARGDPAPPRVRQHRHARDVGARPRRPVRAQHVGGPRRQPSSSASANSTRSAEAAAPASAGSRRGRARTRSSRCAARPGGRPGRHPHAEPRHRARGTERRRGPSPSAAAGTAARPAPTSSPPAPAAPTYAVLGEERACGLDVRIRPDHVAAVDPVGLEAGGHDHRSRGSATAPPAAARSLPCTASASACATRTRWRSGSPHLRGAERAPSRVLRDVRQALGARAHDAVDGRLGLEPRHHRVQRPHDEEEDHGRDDQERDQRVEEDAVGEARAVDGERQGGEVRLAPDRRDERRDEVATNAATRAPNAAPMTTATASSTTLPRSTKSRNSLSMGMLAPAMDEPATCTA